MEHLDKCPRCSASELAQTLRIKDHSISKEEFWLNECRSCGLLITNPRPAQNIIGTYYQSSDYISHSNSKKSIQDKLYHFARQWALRRKHATIRVHQPQGRVLDVGCGTGEFLAHLMSRGYLVQGVEPELKAREQAIANHGIPVLPSLDLVTETERFQVVTLWHVLEHLPNLRGTFKRAYALLADRGLLVIAVPDRESWDAKHYGPEWAAWDVPRHFTHFRRTDVHAFVQEHGFELISTERMWMDAAYVSMLSESYKGHSKGVSLVKGIFVGLWSNVVSLFTGAPTSSTLYLARKVEP